MSTRGAAGAAQYVQAAAVELRGSNPNAWDNFLKALDARRVEVEDTCITCGAPDQFQRTQGAALEARLLLDLLRTAPDAVAKLREGTSRANR